MEGRDNEAIEMEEITFDFTDIEKMDDSELNQRDHRGFNILMVAAETGNVQAVESLINRFMDLDFEVGGQTAASLAFANGHHEIVLNLLRANAKFPTNYKDEGTTDELKAFVELSTNMHEAVKSAEEENLESFEKTKNYLKEKVEKSPTLRHFYDTNNISLLKTAILSKMFAIYQVLISLNIFLAEDEDIDDIMDVLDVDERAKLRDINFTLSTNIFTDEMMILLRNCKFGPDTPHFGEFVDFIRKAFDFLLDIPPVAIILKIVAATRDLKFIFDFKREFVRYLDPSSEPYTNGIFYLSGKIYIGALGMLDSDYHLDVYSVIAHELCHFAVFLVFENLANPYREKEIQTASEFDLIAKECKNFKDFHRTISSVFNDYPEDMQHAELIVRVPELIAKYFNDQDTLLKLREKYAKLFEFYEEKIVAEFERELPKIQEKYRPNKKIEKKVKKLKVLKIFLIIALALSIPLGIYAAWFFYSPTYSWRELTEEQKLKFQNAKLNFYDVELKFDEIAGNDSIIYDLLSSEQIKYGLSDDAASLSDAIKSSYSQHVVFNWQNMSESLKDKFVCSKVNFQGKNFAFNEILKNFSVLSSLSGSQIQNTFEHKLFNVSQPTEIKVNYFRRFFIDEAVEVKSFSHYKNGTINQNREDVESLEKILDEVNNTKVFLLSNLAGEGKSTTFRNLAIELKLKFPKNWIQFVDLKKHFVAYESGVKVDLKQSEELLKFLTLNLLNLNELESEIFTELFNESRVVFLWDGIDEIAPLYKNFMLDLTSAVKTSSNSLQFISSRPQYSRDFRRKFKIKAHKLIPLGKSERFEFLVKFIASENFQLNPQEIWEEYSSGNLENKRLFDLFEEGQKILDSIESSNVRDRLVTNPLLLRMIAEILNDENLKENSNLNIYKIFKVFINKKMKILRKKGKIAEDEVDEVLSSSSVNVIQVHQAYALKHIFTGYLKTLKGKNFTTSTLKIMETTSKLSNAEISRYGILYVSSEGEFSFAHQTFAEFLVAWFLIDNFERFSLESVESDSELKVLLLNSVLYNEKFKVVEKFLQNFAKVEGENLKVYESLRKFPKFSKILERETLKISNLESFRNFFLNLQNFDRKVKVFDFYDKLKEEINKKFVEASKIKFVTTFRSSRLSADDFENFLQNFDEIQKNFGYENLRNLSMSKNSKNETLLHELFYYTTNEKFIGEYLNKTRKFLSKSDFLFLMHSKHYNNETPLMLAARRLPFDELKFFCDFFLESLSDDEIRGILVEEGESSESTLQYSTKNNDVNSFLLIRDLHERLFSQEIIRELITRTHKDVLPFIESAIWNPSSETAREVAEYLEKLFKSEKTRLRKLFYQRDDDGDSAFSFLKNMKEVEGNLKIFIELFRKTFDESQQREFEEAMTFLNERYKESGNVSKLRKISN